MALVTCPDCGKRVSDQAPACPSCGRPIARVGSMRVGKEQSIELTSKRFKINALLSVCAFILGALLIVLPPPGSPLIIVGSIVVLLAIIAYIVTRVRTWWHHG